MTACGLLLASTTLAAAATPATAETPAWIKVSLGDLQVGDVIQHGVYAGGSCQFAFTIDGGRQAYFDAQTDTFCNLRLVSKDPRDRDMMLAPFSEMQPGQPRSAGWCSYPNTATGQGYVRSYSVLLGIQFETARVTYPISFEYNYAYACLDATGPITCSWANNYHLVANTCYDRDDNIGPANPIHAHAQGEFVRNDGQYDHTLYIHMYGWNDGHSTCSWSHIGSVEYGVSGGC